MKMPYPAVLVAAEPTLYRTGLVALLPRRWPALPPTSTADAGQVVDLVRGQAFQALILDEGLPGRALPTLLHHLHQARPGQRRLVLAPGGTPPWRCPCHPGCCCPGPRPPATWQRPWPPGSMKRPARARPPAPAAHALQCAQAASAAPGGGRPL